MHIRISLDAKFQLKLKISIFFGPNLPKKGIFSRKRKNHTHAHDQGRDFSAREPTDTTVF